MEKEQRTQTILELKEIMKKLATIADTLSPSNKQYLVDATQEIKFLCEVLDY